MAESAREVWITGIGIVSCLGEGPDAHWQKLTEAQPHADTTSFAPFVVHPLAPINFDAQIPKKGDQRQMENWQRIGTYAAGLALALQIGEVLLPGSPVIGMDNVKKCFGIQSFFGAA